jgi:hypothetical protein
MNNIFSFKELGIRIFFKNVLYSGFDFDKQLYFIAINDGNRIYIRREESINYFLREYDLWLKDNQSQNDSSVSESENISDRITMLENKIEQLTNCLLVASINNSGAGRRRRV